MKIVPTGGGEATPGSYSDGDDPGEIGCAISRGEAGIGDDVKIVFTKGG